MEFINQNQFKNNSGIYIITNNMNDKVYIGQTRQKFIKRYWHHQWKLRNNSHDNVHLQNAWNLYGEDNFKFSILEVVNKVDNLNDSEIKHISHYKELNRCYNIQEGGQEFSGYIRTNEIKKSIGEKNRIHMTGKKLSEKTKLKMSKSHIGKHYNKDKYILSDEIAFIIKTKLIDGIKPRIISEELNINYKFVNSILSNNTWKHVLVDGWEEFRSNRKTYTRFTKEDDLEVFRLYTEENLSIKEIADFYGKTSGAITYAINRVKKLQSIT